MILQNTIKKASQFLKNNNISSHQLDAEIILCNIMKIKKEFLLTNGHLDISANILKKFNLAVNRRAKSEPVAYITGIKVFWSEDFVVNRNTLVPRPETELLIYKVVDFYKNKKIDILDIGTGSGCILLAILKELNFSSGIGIDISIEAIRTAEINSKNLNLSHRSKFQVCDLEKFNSGIYDLIVSNPPYIPSKDLKKLSKDILNFEPMVALNGGQDGLNLIKKVIYRSSKLLKKDGLLAIEIGHSQYKRVLNVLKLCGFDEISKEYDYNSNVRCIISTKTRNF